MDDDDEEEEDDEDDDEEEEDDEEDGERKTGASGGILARYSLACSVFVWARACCGTIPVFTGILAVPIPLSATGSCKRE